MPPPIGRRRLEEFRRAFTGEINSLAALYRDAAADMMDVLADAAALAGQRGRAAALLRQYQVVLADLGDEAAAWIEINIPRAYHYGLAFADEGVHNIRRAGINLRRREREVFAQVHREAAAAIVEAMLQTTNAALAQIGRRVDDAFRREGMLAVARGIAAGRARVEVSRELEQRLRAAGKPAFVDARGREWPLDRYAEMVARTTTREAMTQGTINRLREHGVTLGQVSAHNAEDFCRYYENAIVVLEGTHPVYPPISAIQGGPPFHPNCVHVLTPFVERLATPEERQRGIISPDVLNRSPAELQRRFRQEFPRAAQAAGRRTLARAARVGVVPGRVRARTPRLPLPEPAVLELQPGTILRRTYKGREYVAEITWDGKVLCNHQIYRSLTELARDITGQGAISGPRFFGVAEKGKRAGQSAAAATAKRRFKDALEMTQRVCDELAAMMQTKVEWNGELRLKKDSFHGAHKDYDCGIALGSSVRPALEKMIEHTAESWAKVPLPEKQHMTTRFTTLVHEVTHGAGPLGAIREVDYISDAQQWLEEAVTSAAAEEVAPTLFARVMGFDSGLSKREFCMGASYPKKQQGLAKALQGPRAGRWSWRPMEGVPPDLYLNLAYQTRRSERVWTIALQMAQIYGKMGMTPIEIEAQLHKDPEKFIFDLAARALLERKG